MVPIKAKPKICADYGYLAHFSALFGLFDSYFRVSVTAWDFIGGCFKNR
jgi:hypothetical protein